jgi:hypothetical protein
MKLGPEQSGPFRLTPVKAPLPGDCHALGLAWETSVTEPQLLATIRFVHTAIYIVMVVSVFVLLYAGLTGATGAWLWLALGLLAVESAVFAGYGFKCPLTAMAVRHGAVTGHVFDTFLPERVTRNTFRVFGSLMAIGVLLLVARWLGLLA